MDLERQQKDKIYLGGGDIVRDHDRLCSERTRHKGEEEEEVEEEDEKYQSFLTGMYLCYVIVSTKQEAASNEDRIHYRWPTGKAF